MPIVATVFVMLFLWISAVPILSWYEQSAAHQQLDDASFRWHQQHIGSYSFEFDTLREVDPGLRLPLRIHVRDGEFAAAYEVESGRAVDILHLDAVPSSIDDAFAIVIALLERRPYSLDVRYDPTHAFPARIEVRQREDGDTETWYLRSFRETE